VYLLSSERGEAVEVPSEGGREERWAGVLVAMLLDYPGLDVGKWKSGERCPREGKRNPVGE
jgi:hypothetical protein